MFKRYSKLEDTASDSIFLFGARQTGKTTLIGELFPNAPRYDLLDSVTSNVCNEPPPCYVRNWRHYHQTHLL